MEIIVCGRILKAMKALLVLSVGCTSLDLEFNGSQKLCVERQNEDTLVLRSLNINSTSKQKASLFYREVYDFRKGPSQRLCVSSFQQMLLDSARRFNIVLSPIVSLVICIHRTKSNIKRLKENDCNKFCEMYFEPI